MNSDSDDSSSDDSRREVVVRHRSFREARPDPLPPYPPPVPQQATSEGIRYELRIPGPEAEMHRSNGGMASRQEDERDERDENGNENFDEDGYETDSTIESTESQCSILESDIVDYMFILPDYVFGDPSSSAAKTFMNNMRRIPKRLINTTDANGNTLFLIACQYACVEVVDILLKRHADPHWVNDSGANGLHFACYKDSLSMPIAETLLSLHVSTNVPERQYGCTPLHYAASAGDLALCELLVECGAYVHAHDYDGCDSIAYARDAGMTEVAEFLTQALKVHQNKGAFGPGTAATVAAQTATAKAVSKTAFREVIVNDSTGQLPSPAVSIGRAKVRMIINTSAGSFDSTYDEGEVEGSHNNQGGDASATPNRRTVYDYSPQEEQSVQGQHRAEEARTLGSNGTPSTAAQEKTPPPSGQNSSSAANRRNIFQPTNPSPYKPLPPSPVNINAAMSNGFGRTNASNGERGSTAGTDAPPLPSPAFTSPDGYGGYSDVESTADLSPVKFELYIERAKFNARFQKEQALHREMVASKDARIQSLQGEVRTMRSTIQDYQDEVHALSAKLDLMQLPFIEATNALQQELTALRRENKALRDQLGEGK